MDKKKHMIKKKKKIQKLLNHGLRYFFYLDIRSPPNDHQSFIIIIWGKGGPGGNEFGRETEELKVAIFFNIYNQRNKTNICKNQRTTCFRLFAC